MKDKNVERKIALWALEEAIKGGYPELVISYKQPLLPYSVPIAQVFLDPLFWQALARAMGKDSPITEEDRKQGTTLRRYWQIYWHSFIDHLIEGGDPESFFESLLGNKD